MNKPAFAPPRGVEAIEATASSGGDFTPGRKIEYLPKIEKGGSLRLRFLTPLEQMPICARHEYVLTKPAPTPGAKGWPESLPAVCRRDRAFGGAFPDCYICEAQLASRFDPGKFAKAQPKTWAIACLRTNLTRDGKPLGNGPDGKPIWKDLARKAKIKNEKTGEVEEVWERALVVICQPSKTFWANLLVVAARVGNDVTGMDYEIVRQGEGLDTAYLFFNMAADPSIAPGTEHWKAYEQAMQTQGYVLDDIICNAASDEFYAKFFDPRVTVNDKGEIVAATTTGTPASPAAEASLADRVKALRAETATVGAGGSWAAPSDDPWADNGNEPGF